VIHAIVYVLIGSAVSFFLQSHIKWLARHWSRHWMVRPILEIVLNAAISLSWLITAPMLLVTVRRLKRKESK
jgi:hypothetical protein